MCAATDRSRAEAAPPREPRCRVTPPATLELDVTAQAPRRARRFLVAAACPAHVPADLVDTAALLVSELVTNAVRHGAPPLAVTLSCRTRSLLVEVADGSMRLPQQRSIDGLAEGGRGVPLVASLSAGWGVRARGGGKVTWFRLAL
jgi:anti-sigma regulatory factor (Ser/Thr protein kinase)